MNKREHIASLLMSNEIDEVISGTKILESLVNSKAQLYHYIPCQEVSSFEDLITHFKGMNSTYMALWYLGMLAAFEVQWVNEIVELDLHLRRLANRVPRNHLLYELRVLPDSIGNLINLKSLDLGNNELTVLPDSLGNLTELKSLYLASNELSVIPDSIGSMTRLEELELS